MQRHIYFLPRNSMSNSRSGIKVPIRGRVASNSMRKIYGKFDIEFDVENSGIRHEFDTLVSNSMSFDVGIRYVNVLNSMRHQI